MNKYHILALSCIAAHALNGMEIAKNNDWKAEQYKRNSELQYKAAMGALAKIPFAGNERVLDIGCGDGRVTAEIAKRAPKGFVLGIDVSPNMIKYACANHKRDNLSFDLQDISQTKTFNDLAKQIKVRPVGFDIVTAFSSLSWIKDQQQAFTNICRLLVWKGQLRAGLAHEDSSYLRARLAMHTHDKWKEFFVGYEVPYYPLNEEKVKKMLEIAGLKSLLVAKIEVPQLFAIREDFINWMRVIPVQIDRIPEARHEEFFNDIVDEYLKEVPATDDGSIPLTVAALAVHAEVPCDLSWM